MILCLLLFSLDQFRFRIVPVRSPGNRIDIVITHLSEPEQNNKTRNTVVTDNPVSKLRLGFSFNS